MASAKASVHICQRCGDICRSFRELFNHIRKRHSLESNFSVRCEIKNCKRSYKKLESYRRHVYSKHPGAVDRSSNSSVSYSDNEAQQGIPELIVEDVEMSNTELPQNNNSINSLVSINMLPSELKRQLSLLFLKLKVKYHVPDTGLHDICIEINMAIQTTTDIAVQRISQHLKIDAQELQSLDLCDYMNNIHDTLSSTHKREEYLKNTFSVILPIQKSFTLPEASQKVYAHYIPLREVLIAYILRSDVWGEINRPVIVSDTHLTDCFDGSYMKSIYEEDTIYLLLYTDEFEICNPLGAKRGKQKIFAVYFTCLNIHPKFRSKLDSIHLLLLVKQLVLKKLGMNVVLEPLFKMLKDLESNPISVNGRTFKVIVPFLSGDNLGTHAVSGFTQSFGHGRICRFCMATRNTSDTLFKETDFVLRTFDVHQAHLTSIEADPTQAGIYGVHSRCILQDLKHFCVTKSLPPDVMHDILEGSVQVVLTLVIPKILPNNLELLNHCIENFHYHYTDKAEKPVTLTKGSIKGSASQKWCLFRLLSLFIADVVPVGNQFWELYLLFRRILDIVMAPVIPKNYIPYLETCIYDFLIMLKELFPENRITPKLHYLVHYPRLMVEFGPLLRFWTMRFEAQHSYFKDAAKNTRCFKNISLSLSKHYQYLQAYQFSSTVLLNLPSFTKSSSEIKVSNLPTCAQEALVFLYGNTLPEHITKCSSIVHECVEYREDGVYCFGFFSGLPVFVWTQNVFLIKKDIILYGMYFVSTHFDHHFHVYCVENIGPVAQNVNNLLDKHSLPLYRVHDTFMVNMRYSVFDE